MDEREMRAAKPAKRSGRSSGGGRSRSSSGKSRAGGRSRSSSGSRGGRGARTRGASSRAKSAGGGRGNAGAANGGQRGARTAGRDAIALLTSDHRMVEHLLAQAAHDGSVVEQIRTELEAHATVEEELFYPAVRKALADKGREMVEEALQEHDAAREAVDELIATDEQDEGYDARLEELKQKIQHHVQEEENEMFPQAREALSADELMDLGSRMESRKEELKAELVEA